MIEESVVEDLPTSTTSALQLQNKKHKWLADLVDDRAALIEQLSVFNLSARQEQLVAALVDGGTLPLAKVLRSLKMSMTEFFEILREARSALSEYRAKELVDIYRPRVVRAAMEGALIKKKPCKDCKGAGEIADFRTGEMLKCYDCGGSGVIEIHPDHERQKTALQISGVLAKQGAGIAVTVNNTNNQVEGFRSSTDFRGITDRLMYASVQKSVDTEFTALPEKKEEEKEAPAVEVVEAPVVVEVQAPEPPQEVSPPQDPIAVAAKPVGKHKKKEK